MRAALLFYIFILPSKNCSSQSGMIAGTPALAYWKVGQGKETIIVLHGGPATQHDYLRPEFDNLKDVSTVVFYDQRGCGLSERSQSYTWHDHVADLRRVIATFPKGKVILAGSSWGTLLALAYTYQYPEDVKGVILTGTVRWYGLGMSKKRYEQLKGKLYKPKAERVIPATITEKQYGESNGDTAEQKVVNRKLTTIAGPANLEPIFSFKTAPILRSLKEVKVPALIFNGDREACIIDWGNKYAKVLPNAEIVTISGACHDPWLNNPKAFFAKCNAFVNSLP